MCTINFMIHEMRGFIVYCKEEKITVKMATRLFTIRIWWFLPLVDSLCFFLYSLILSWKQRQLTFVANPTHLHSVGSNPQLKSSTAFLSLHWSSPENPFAGVKLIRTNEIPATTIHTAVEGDSLSIRCNQQVSGLSVWSTFQCCLEIMAMNQSFHRFPWDTSDWNISSFQASFNWSILFRGISKRSSSGWSPHRASCTANVATLLFTIRTWWLSPLVGSLFFFLWSTIFSFLHWQLTWVANLKK